jgi:hypothetical protein
MIVEGASWGSVDRTNKRDELNGEKMSPTGSDIHLAAESNPKAAKLHTELGSRKCV